MVSRCFPGGYNVKLYISRGRLAWWLLTFLHSVIFEHMSLLQALYHLLKASHILNIPGINTKTILGTALEQGKGGAMLGSFGEKKIGIQ